MLAPGPQVIQRDTPPSRSAATDTDTWFVCGLAEKGPTVPKLVRSMDEFTQIYGKRISASVLADSVEAAFREGVSRVYVSRVLGPAQATAEVDLPDSGAAVSLVASALTPGDWGNDLNVDVDAGGADGTFVLIVTHDTDGELERSPDLADRGAAVAWAASSDYIRLALGASTNDPAPAAAVSLTGGDDDHTGAVDANWQTALDRFGIDLGPGQVSFPGRTTAAAHTALLNHARDRNRVALLDLPDTATAATLRTSALALRGLDADRYGAAFAPWAKIPGVLPGTTRTVPYSAIQAGLIARSDAANNPNEPAAGANGQARYAIDLSQAEWAEADRESLNEAGVNVARIIYGGVRTYGYRTLVDPLGVKQTWLMLSNARLYMAVAAQGEAISERFVFAQLDGKRVTITKYHGALVGMLHPFFERGALYGATPEEAFSVDTGPSVNTDETIAAGELRAVIALRMSPFGERVVLELVKVPITEAI